MALVRAAADTGCAREYQSSRQEQPLRADKLDRYLRRNKISSEITSLPVSLGSAHAWKVPEQILYNNVALITGSFESSRWTSAGKELIILSSPNQEIEKTALHQFLAQLEMAKTSASLGQVHKAGAHWRQSFEHADILATGQYHDTLPNILQKVNDLRIEGHGAVATKLVSYLAECSAAHSACGSIRAIYQALRLVHLDDMGDLEERVMQGYVDLFDKFLGLGHYNSFVMRMNLARRRLSRNPMARLEDHLPSLEFFDDLFGESDTRCLDIIRLRVETLFQRGNYIGTEKEANLLVARASLKVKDPWQQLYFLIKGYYHLGLAQYRLGKMDSANSIMYQGIQCIGEFSLLDEYGVFDSDHATLMSCLQELT